MYVNVIKEKTILSNNEGDLGWKRKGEMQMLNYTKSHLMVSLLNLENAEKHHFIRQRVCFFKSRHYIFNLSYTLINVQDFVR